MGSLSSDVEVVGSDCESLGVGRVRIRLQGGQANIQAPAAKEVRSLSSNYEALLQQATLTIRSLTKEKARLEAEQDRLLNVNIELAGEVKRLLDSQKESRAEQEGLLAANEELAGEVTRLYGEQEVWEGEQQQYQEREARLADSVRMLSADNARLCLEKEEVEREQGRTSQELRTRQMEESARQEAALACIQATHSNSSTLFHIFVRFSFYSLVFRPSLSRSAN